MRSPIRFARAAVSAAALLFTAACSAADGPLNPSESQLADSAPRAAAAAGSNQKPLAWISKPAQNSSSAQGASIAFSGNGFDKEDGPLSGSTLAWSSSRDGQIGTGKSFTRNTLSAGSHTITLTATDAAGATFSHNRAITITGVANTAPSASISAPTNNISVSSGISVSFAGTGTDPQDGALSGASLGWTSSRDGQIGAGTAFSTTNLSIGTHIITLTSTDAQGATGAATRTITVTAPTAGPNQPPTGLIATPAHDAAFAQGVSVSFNGSGTDPEDGALTGASLVWVSSRDGQIGTGTSFTKSNLSIGWHTVSLTFTDSQGATFVHNRMLNITAAVANQAPTAGITAPSNNSSAAQGANVSFAGTGSDAESGSLTGASLVWTSSRDGQIGTGTSFSKTNLSVGTHTITLTAKDAQNATGVATRTISITVPANLAPVANFTISCLLLACNFDAGSSSDDAGIVQYAWNWGSGVLTRTVPLISNTFLVVGTVNISLTVTDAAGLTSSITKAVSLTGGSTGGSTAEPTGMSMLADRAFNCIEASSCGEGGWYYSGPSNASTLVLDATAPKSASYVVQQNFMSSLPGGSSPASLGTGIASKKTIYVSMWMKLSPNFQGHPTSTNKVVHLYINGSNRAYTMVRGTGSGALVPSFGLQGLAAPYTHIDEAGNANTSESVNLVPNVGTKNIIRGQWHRYEIVMVANTAGVANGSAEMWVDGVKVISNSGIMFTGSGENSMWHEVNWSPTWGGAGGGISSTFTASMDHMYISGK